MIRAKPLFVRPAVDVHIGHRARCELFFRSRRVRSWHGWRGQGKRGCDRDCDTRKSNELSNHPNPLMRRRHHGRQANNVTPTTCECACQSPTSRDMEISLTERADSRCGRADSRREAEGASRQGCRRNFLTTGFVVIALLMLGHRPVRATERWSRLVAVRDHPEPRAGVSAAWVLHEREIHNNLDAISAFEMVRKFPEVVDGIRCRCGCAELPGYYSLLSCFGGEGMAQHCETCREVAVLVCSLAARGRTLAQIRAAVDSADA